MSLCHIFECGREMKKVGNHWSKVTLQQAMTHLSFYTRAKHSYLTSNAKYEFQDLQDLLWSNCYFKNNTKLHQSRKNHRLSINISAHFKYNLQSTGKHHKFHNTKFLWKLISHLTDQGALTGPTDTPDPNGLGVGL